jgi:hypothetical protein
VLPVVYERIFANSDVEENEDEIGNNLPIESDSEEDFMVLFNRFYPPNNTAIEGLNAGNQLIIKVVHEDLELGEIDLD